MNIFTSQNRFGGQALAFLTAVSMVISFLPVSATFAQAATTGITASPSDLTLEIDEKGNFVVSTTFDDVTTDGTYIDVSDNGAGTFYSGTIGGDCNSDTPVTELSIDQNKGVCYSNSAAGDFVITVQLYSGENSPIGDPYYIDVHVNTPEVIEVLGCTDDTASNYNPEATEDDGSCVVDSNDDDTPVCDEESQKCDPVDDEEVPVCVDEEPAWAATAFAHYQGLTKAGNAVAVNRSDEVSSLGEADWTDGDSDGFFSLGFGGWIEVVFDGYVVDVDGDDISIHEATNGNSYPEELARIEVSQDADNWYEIGSASNLDDVSTRVSYFDFSSTGLSWIKYVRVTDTTDSSIHNNEADAFDLDAVDATKKVCDQPEEPEGDVKVIKKVIGEDKGPASLDEFSFLIDGEDKTFFDEEGVAYLDLPIGNTYVIDETDIPQGYSHVTTYCSVKDDKDHHKDEKEWNNEEDQYDSEENWKNGSEEERGDWGRRKHKRGNNEITPQEDKEVVCVILNKYSEPLSCNPEVNLLANGSFEDVVVENKAGWDIFQSGLAGLGWFADWVISLGAPEIANIEVQTSSLWTPSDGNQYAELDSDWGGPGSNDGPDEVARTHIYQFVPTIPGETYTLTWDFSPRPRTDVYENDLLAFVNNVVVAENTASGEVNSDTVWESHSYSFVASGDETSIAFEDIGTHDSVGTLLDNVSLSCEPEVTDEEYTLTIEITGEGFGTVTSDEEAGIVCSTQGEEGEICEKTYPAGTVVDLSAVADEGSNFDNSWTVDAGTCTGNTSPCQVTMNSDIDLVAHFDLNDISTTPGGGGGGGRKIELGGGSSGTTDEESNGSGPIPQVAGEQVSVVPFGAPNAGAGGAAPTTPLTIPTTTWLGLVAIANHKRYVR